MTECPNVIACDTPGLPAACVRAPTLDESGKTDWRIHDGSRDESGRKPELSVAVARP